MLYLALLPVMYCTVIEECVRDKERFRNENKLCVFNVDTLCRYTLVTVLL